MKAERSMCLPMKRFERQKWRRMIGPLLFVTVAVITCYTVFHGRNIKSIFQAMSDMNVGFVVGAFLCALFFVAAEGMMLWYLLHSVDEAVGLPQCIRYSFIGFFFSGITPSATGGQPVQLYYMNRDGIRTGDATAVLMGVATAYKLVLALIGTGLLLFWRKELHIFLGSYIILYDMGLFLNILLVAILLGMMCTQGIRKFIEAAERILVRLHLCKPSIARKRKIEELADTYHETVLFFQKRKGKVLAVVLFTLLQRASMFFLTWLIYRGMHLDGVSVWQIMAMQAAVTIAVDMLPLPGAQGISEMVYYAAFAGIIPAGLLIPSMCAARGISFYFLLAVSAVVSAVSYLNGRKKAGVFCRIGTKIATDTCIPASDSVQ